MKYYFLNFLELGDLKSKISLYVKEEFLVKNLKKSEVLPFNKWTYQNIYVNGNKVSISQVWNKDIKEGYMKIKNKIYPIKNFVLINNSPLVKDINKTKGNWENWWEKIRKKSDVDLYDDLWVKAEKELDAEPLFIEKDFKNKIVLDAGCGTGRYLPYFSNFGAKEIVGVDLGKQVFKAWEQEVPKKNLHLVQSDLTNMPFRKEMFDTIASHGVLHHTPNPFFSFKKLSEHLKLGGVQAIYVYHKEWWHFSAHKKSYLLDFLYDGGILIWQTIRKIMSRMPHFIIITFCYLLAVKGTIEQSLMNKKNWFLKTLGKLSFIIPPICYIGVNYHERVVRNYDHYSATFNYFQTIDEVVDWYRKSGFNDIEIASIPVSIRGKKTLKQEPIRIKQYKFVSHFEFREMWEKFYNKINEKNTKIKIVYLITGLGYGGAEKQLYYLLKNLSKNKKLTISLIALSDGIYHKKILDLGIKVYCLSEKFSTKYFLRYLTNIRKIIKRINPDIVQSCLFHTNIILKFLLYFMKKNFKVICSYRSQISKLPTIKFLERFNMKKVDLTISNSIVADNDLRIYNKLIINKVKRVVINNGFESEDIDKAKIIQLEKRYSNKKVILTVGRFSPEKDYETNIKTCHELLSYRNDFVFLYVGDGNPNPYSKMLNQKKLNHKIKILGKVNYIFELLSVADAFFLPTLFESQCNALMEAMYMKVPIVTTNIKENLSLVSKASFCNLRDYKQMAKELNNVLNKEFPIRNLLINHNLIKNEFSLSQLSKKYYKEYIDLL